MEIIFHSFFCFVLLIIYNRTPKFIIDLCFDKSADDMFFPVIKLIEKLLLKLCK